MNVIVIVTDSLRADHLGCYGNDWISTPNLDALAEESLVFDNAYAEGLPTMPERAAWWTGRYTLHDRGWEPMREDDVLLAEWLFDKGYASALITDVYHMHKPSYNCGRGFDHVEFIRGQEYDAWAVSGPEPDLGRWHRLRGPAPESAPLWAERFRQYLRNISVFPDWWESDEHHFMARTVRAAVHWLRNLPRRDRVFLWLDMFDPHEPWDPPSPYREMYDPGYDGVELIDPVPGDTEGYMSPEEVRHTAALYAGEVTLVDKWIGVLLEALGGLDMLDTSLIIHTSDHGEPLGERGYIRKARRWCHEELTRVPLIIRHPEGRAAGRRTRSFVQPQDLFAGVIDFLGLSAPGEGGEDSLFPLLERGRRSPWPYETPTKHLHGISFMPLFDVPGRMLRREAVSGWHRASWSLRDEEHSYTRYLDPSLAPAGENELFDRVNDRLESTNIIADRPDVAADMDRRLQDFFAGLRRQASSTP